MFYFRENSRCDTIRDDGENAESICGIGHLWDTVELYCLHIFVDLNLLQLKNLTCIPPKANPLMFAASSGRSRTVDTALKAISELFSKYEDEDQQ